MKNMIKKNQVMITALAIMIAVAGYLNFAGTKVTEEEIVSVTSDTITDDNGLLLAEDEYSAVVDISDEDILAMEEYDATEEIASLDSDTEGEPVTDLAEGETALGAEEEVPGEAVFASASSVSALAAARLQKEQTRSQNKETLLEIINNTNISETQKQEAVDHMIQMTDVAEKETAAEILLEAKGFSDAIVSIEENNVDVVVGASELTEAQRAQIEDIVTRKTGMEADAVVISTVAENGTQSE